MDMARERRQPRGSRRAEGAAMLPTVELEQSVPSAQPAARGMRSRLLRLLGRVAMWLWPVALVLGAWQAWITFAHVPRIVAPPPKAVVTYMRDNPGAYWSDAWSFLKVVVEGTVLGVAVGVVLAALSWSLSLIRATVGPISLVSQCLPIVVMIPILGRIFGYHPHTIVIIAAIVAFF